MKVNKVDLVEPLKPGQVRADVTEECTVTTGGRSYKTHIGVIDGPLFSDIDGVLSWRDVSNLVFQVDVARHVYGFVEEMPPDLNTWAKWKLVANRPVVMFDCPDGAGTARIVIDTGAENGVWLGPTRWQEWRVRRATQLATLEAGLFLADRLIILDVFRAKRISVGGITLSDVPVSKAPPFANLLWKDCDAELGLFAFSRLRLIIDGKNGWIYTCPISNPTTQYAYNRLGAVFVPKDVDKDDDLIAHVVDGSPAYRAGIRDGDVLLKIGILNVTVWRTDPYILPLSRFWSRPAGTKDKLTLKRGDKQFEATVTLEELPAVD